MLAICVHMTKVETVFYPLRLMYEETMQARKPYSSSSPGIILTSSFVYQREELSDLCHCLFLYYSHISGTRGSRHK